MDLFSAAVRARTHPSRPGAFYAFVRAAWPHTGDPAPFVDAMYIRVMCDALQRVACRESPDLLTNIPPSHSKSMIHAVLYQPWVWTWWPQHRLGAISYAETPVLRDAVKARTLIESEWYQEKWPLRISNETNAKGYYINEHGGSRLSTTIRSGITANHFDDILVDDPQNPTNLHQIDEAQTESAKARYVWDHVLPSRVVSMRTSRRIVVMQRLAMTDLSQHILDQRRPIEHLMLPLHYDPDRACRLDWRTQRGELLAPERYTEEDLTLALGDTDPAALAAQYEQDPTASGAGIYRLEDFRSYGPGELPRRGLLAVSVDGATAGRPTTRGGASENSNWAVTAWLVSEGRYYLLAADAFKEDLDVVVGRIPAFVTQVLSGKKTGWVPDDLIIERRSTGEGAGSFLKDADLGGLTIVYRDANESKTERAHAARLPIRQGRVFLPARVFDERGLALSYAEQILQREIKTFPRGRTDDLIDSMNQCILHYQEKLGGVVKKATAKDIRAAAAAVRRRRPYG